MTEVFTYETEKAIVRIHPGNVTEEGFRAAIEQAARKFYSDIRKDQKKEKGKNDKS